MGNNDNDNQKDEKKSQRETFMKISVECTIFSRILISFSVMANWSLERFMHATTWTFRQGN